MLRVLIYGCKGVQFIQLMLFLHRSISNSSIIVFVELFFLREHVGASLNHL